MCAQRKDKDSVVTVNYSVTWHPFISGGEDGAKASESHFDWGVPERKSS